MSEDLETSIIAGDEAEKFALSPVGKAMLQLANEDADASIIAFSEVDLSDKDKVAKIQQDLRTAMRFPNYLAEIVQRGREAMSVYQQQEDAKKGTP